jgi:hypothetical protein
MTSPAAKISAWTSGGPAQPAKRPTKKVFRGICNFVLSTEVLKADQARLFQLGKDAAHSDRVNLFLVYIEKGRCLSEGAAGKIKAPTSGSKQPNPL